MLKINYPTVQLAYYVFTDILGFSKMIENAKQKNTTNDLLRRLHSVVVKRREALEYFGEFCQIRAFSDNVVLGIPINKHSDAEGEFGLAVIQILEYQLEMALEGFFIRGGMSIGDLFMDDKMIFGDSIIEAYKLESIKAIYPRVILSDSVVSLISEHIKYYNDVEDSPQRKHIIKDDDGYSYFNYLNAIIDDDGFANWTKLCKHRDAITQKLNDPINLPCIDKYQWLKKYHNDFCSKMQHYEGYDEKFKI